MTDGFDYNLHFLPAVSALKDKGIAVDTYEHNHGWICVIHGNKDKDDRCDFILSPFSYGHEDNLLEWWDGEGQPKGSLTCDEAVEQCLDWLEKKP